MTKEVPIMFGDRLGGLLCLLDSENVFLQNKDRLGKWDVGGLSYRNRGSGCRDVYV